MLFKDAKAGHTTTTPFTSHGATEAQHRKGLRNDLTGAPSNAKIPAAAALTAPESLNTSGQESHWPHTPAFRKPALSDCYTPGTRPRAEDTLHTSEAAKHNNQKSVRWGNTTGVPARAANPTRLPGSSSAQRKQQHK